MSSLHPPLPDFGGVNNKNQKAILAFGNKLKTLRKSKGLSQEELANHADIPINQVGRIERAEVNTTISTIYALADALKIDVIEFFLK